MCRFFFFLTVESVISVGVCEKQVQRPEIEIRSRGGRKRGGLASWPVTQARTLTAQKQLKVMTSGERKQLFLRVSVMYFGLDAAWRLGGLVGNN